MKINQFFDNEREGVAEI